MEILSLFFLNDHDHINQYIVLHAVWVPNLSAHARMKIIYGINGGVGGQSSFDDGVNMAVDDYGGR